MLPRRSGSDSSSVVCRRTATSASWSSARRRSWAWTLPVATQATPSRSASAGQPAVAGAVAPPQRPLQLDPEALGGRRRRAAAARSARRRRGSPARPAPGRAPPSRAQPDRQTSPSLRSHSESSASAGGRGSRSTRGRVSACASVSSRQRLRQPVGALDQQRQMEHLPRMPARVRRRARVGHRQLGAHDRPHPEPATRLGELHRPADAVVVGEREGLDSRARRRAWRAPRAARRRRRTSTRSGREARRSRPSDRPLLEPAPRRDRLRRLAEDDDVAPVGEHDLEIASLQGFRRPPAILDQPLLAHRIDRDAGRRRAARRRRSPAPATGSGQ